MIYDVQGKIKLDLPPVHADIITAYNTEWSGENSQGWEVKNFIDLTKNKKCLYDVGGNVGFFSLVFVNNNAEEIDKESFCFEPSPWGTNICFEILDHSKQHDKIKLFPYFVGDKNGEANILVEEAAHTFVVEYERLDPDCGFKIEAKGPPMPNEMITLDAFSELVAKERGLELDTVKIDVEGYEYKVLVGSIKTIMTYRPLIFLEVHSHLLNMYNTTALDVYNFVTGLNYQMFDIHMNEVTTKEQYLDLFENILETRFVCNPREKEIV